MKKGYCILNRIIFPAERKSESAASIFHWQFLKWQEILNKRNDGGQFKYTISKYLYIIKCPNTNVAKEIWQQLRDPQKNEES